jgi:hypothetical protein
MIARGLPRAVARIGRASTVRPVRPPTIVLNRRECATPTKPLNATEVTIERDALFSPSARTILSIS